MQALRMRRAYVQCILKQDIGWFDANPAGQIPTTVTANMAKVQDGLGRKTGDIVFYGVSGEKLFSRGLTIYLLPSTLSCCLNAELLVTTLTIAMLAMIAMLTMIATSYPGVALLGTAIIINWELGLVMLACVPFIGGSVAILSKLMSSSTQEAVDHYSKAGGVATEVRLFPNKEPSGWSSG